MKINNENKNNKKTISIYRNDKKLVYSGIIEKIPIKYESILSYSIKYYDNHEPCRLIRSAVRANIYMEFSEYFNSIESQNVQIIELPENLQSYMLI